MHVLSFQRSIYCVPMNNISSIIKDSVMKDKDLQIIYPIHCKIKVANSQHSNYFYLHMYIGTYTYVLPMPNYLICHLWLHFVNSYYIYKYF